MATTKLFILSSAVLLLAVVVSWYFPNHINILHLPNIATLTAKMVKRILQKQDQIVSNVNSYTPNTPDARKESSPTATDDVVKGETIFSREELSMYTTDPIYLGILGKVFDVTSGSRHYGLDGGYHFFAGRDGTRAFVTGQFNEEGLTDDLEGLTPTEMLEIQNWLEFYETDYKYVGKLKGRFYDEKGNPTSDLRRAWDGIKRGQQEKASQEAEKRRFPPCNSEFNQKTGLRLWCSNRSGGIARNWVGVPRKLFSPASGSYRCACINEKDLKNPHLRLYDGCDPIATSCRPNT